jgi:O-antigen ligase
MIATRKHMSGILLQGLLLLVSLAVGRAVVETQTISADPLVIVLAAAAGALALAMMLMGPVTCLAGVAALTVLPLSAASVAGEVDLFAADAFFAALACWWLIRAAGLGAQAMDPRLRAPLRGGPVLIFLGCVGLSLFYVSEVDPGRLSVSLVSWLRLVQTASLGWLAATFLRTKRDIAFVLGAIAVAGAITVVLALAGGAGHADAGPLGLRGGGVVNPNKLGLVSGLLLLMGTFGALGRSLVYRAPLVLVGVVGLVQSQSVASLVGTSVALLLGMSFMVAPARRIISLRALRTAAVLCVAIVVAYGLAAAIRPTNLPTSEDFQQSSASQRTVLGAAGLELAERHPLTGVGWRRSDEPEVIGDPDVTAELRARFKATKNEFFPDVSPRSVHNAYIQVLAELGLIGFGLFMFMLASLGWGVKKVLDRAPRGTPAWAQLWFMAWGLLLIVIWWNDNPIFGGQVETVIPAIFVGAIASLGRRLWPGERARQAS